MARKKKRPQSDFRIYFKDEAPTLGSGYRGITVIKVGYKWVRLMETGSGYRCKITRYTWDNLIKYGPNGEELTKEQQCAHDPSRATPVAAKRSRKTVKSSATPPSRRPTGRSVETANEPSPPKRGDAKTSD